jgi:hypothetical protein
MYQALLCLSLVSPGQEPCACPPENVCVREPIVTKVKHVSYTCKCSEFCLGHDSILRSLFSGGSCGCGACHVHKKRELVKHVCVEEKCEEKCVLRPACAPCAAEMPAVQVSPPPLKPAPAPVTVISPTGAYTGYMQSPGGSPWAPMPGQ